MNAKELLAILTDPNGTEELAHHWEALRDFLAACGSATPEQVRAALELSDNILAGDNLADDIIKHKAREGDLVRLADHRKAEAGLLKNYRAAVAQKGGEDK